jgi:hypothetical protein
VSSRRLVALPPADALFVGAPRQVIHVIVLHVAIGARRHASAPVVARPQMPRGPARSGAWWRAGPVPRDSYYGHLSRRSTHGGRNLLGGDFEGAKSVANDRNWPSGGRK